jgi:hypothetical protein
MISFILTSSENKNEIKEKGSDIEKRVEKNEVLQDAEADAGDIHLFFVVLPQSHNKLDTLFMCH